MTLEPERLAAAVNGALGGVVYGLYQFAAVALAGHAVSRQDVALLVANVACGILAGALLAYALTAMAVNWIPFIAAKDTTAIGMGIGIFGWELLPLAFTLAKGVARRKAQDLGGGQ